MSWWMLWHWAWGAVITVKITEFTADKKSTSRSQRRYPHGNPPHGQTANGRFYCDVLKRLHERIHEEANVKRSEKTAAAFFSMSTRPRTHRSCSEKSIVIPHLPRSPDLAPCDFFSVLQNEVSIERLPFWHKWANPGASNTYTSGRPRMHGKRWDRCIYAQADYCEGDRGNLGKLLQMILF